MAPPSMLVVILASVSPPDPVATRELARVVRVEDPWFGHPQCPRKASSKHGLSRIPLCGKAVYLTDAVRQWLQQRVTYGQ